MLGMRLSLVALFIAFTSLVVALVTVLVANAPEHPIVVAVWHWISNLF